MASPVKSSRLCDGHNKVEFLIPKDARVCGRWSVDQTLSACLAPWVGVGKRGRVGKIKLLQGLTPMTSCFGRAPDPVWHFIFVRGSRDSAWGKKGAVAWSAPAAAVSVASPIAASNRGWRRPTSWTVTKSRHQCHHFSASRHGCSLFCFGKAVCPPSHGLRKVLPGVPKPPHRFGVPLFDVSVHVASPQ
jgi:hypothetical protein